MIPKRIGWSEVPEEEPTADPADAAKKKRWIIRRNNGNAVGR